ncbi:MAG: hypothetical protein IJA19_04130, partial [Clostridia bacterium]|nr:hypothetical protein [Clostridia bacterium]
VQKYEKEDEYTVSSRYFIFSILAGLFQESINGRPPLLTLPKGTSLLRPGEYVKYATLDGAIEDNRFGELRDICKRVNDCVQKGDHIITVQSVRPEGKYQSYMNVRGIGDKNRTYDVYAHDMTIYPINKVNWEESKIVYKYIPDEHEIATYKRRHPNEPVPEYFEYYLYVDDKRTPEQTLQEILAGTYLRSTKVVSAEITHIKENYFISLPKTNYDFVMRDGQYQKRLRDSYANFKLYDDEYINLEVLTSLEVEYLITTRKVEGQYIGGRAVDYSYFIPYLKKMYKWVKEREDKEYELISKYVKLDDFKDWQILLQQWKISTGHHIIGPKYAREFAKMLIEKVHS